MSGKPLVIGCVVFSDKPPLGIEERPIKPAVDVNLDTIKEEGSTPSLATKSEKEIREVIDRLEAVLNEFKGKKVDDEMVRLLDLQVGKIYALKWVLGEQEKI